MASICPNGHPLGSLLTRPNFYHECYIIRCDNCSQILDEATLAERPGLYCTQRCGYDVCGVCADALNLTVVGALGFGRESSRLFELKAEDVRFEVPPSKAQPHHQEDKPAEAEKLLVLEASENESLVGRAAAAWKPPPLFSIDPKEYEERHKSYGEWYQCHLRGMVHDLFVGPERPLKPFEVQQRHAERQLHAQEAFLAETARLQATSHRSFASHDVAISHGTSQGAPMVALTPPDAETMMMLKKVSEQSSILEPPIFWRHRFSEKVFEPSPAQEDADPTRVHARLRRSRQHFVTSLRMIERRASSDFFADPALQSGGEFAAEAVIQARAMLRLLREPCSSSKCSAIVSASADADDEPSSTANESSTAASVRKERAALAAACRPSTGTLPPRGLEFGSWIDNILGTDGRSAPAPCISCKAVASKAIASVELTGVETLSKAIACTEKTGVSRQVACAPPLSARPFSQGARRPQQARGIASGRSVGGVNGASLSARGGRAVAVVR